MTINITKKSTLSANDSIYIISDNNEQQFLDPIALSSKWQLVDSWIYSSAVSFVSFSNLDVWKDIANYVKFTNSDGSNFTGGSIYVYGKA